MEAVGVPESNVPCEVRREVDVAIKVHRVLAQEYSDSHAGCSRFETYAGDDAAISDLSQMLVLSGHFVRLLVIDVVTDYRDIAMPETA